MTLSRFTRRERVIPTVNPVSNYTGGGTMVKPLVERLDGTQAIHIGGCGFLYYICATKMCALHMHVSRFPNLYSTRTSGMAGQFYPNDPIKDGGRALLLAKPVHTPLTYLRLHWRDESKGSERGSSPERR